MSPMAETTTTTSWPASLVSTIRRATRLMLAASATLEPPYFCTMRDTAQSLPIAVQAITHGPKGPRLVGEREYYVRRSRSQAAPSSASGSSIVAEITSTRMRKYS